MVDDNITFVVLQTKQNTSWSMAERFLKEVDNYTLVNICQQNGPIIIDSIEILGIFYYNSTIKFEFKSRDFFFHLRNCLVFRQGNASVASLFL